MCNRLKPERQKRVLHMLAEGSSIRSAERLTGVHRDTICRLTVQFGKGCQRLMEECFQGLQLRHLELDEVWTFVLKKQGRLTVEERRERADVGDMYLWTALDKYTKLVPAYLVGKRSADNARRFFRDVASRLVFPAPHQSDAHAYGAGGYRPIVQLSSDAFKGYPEAVDLAFGAHAKYGQIIKDYRNADQPGRYAPPEMIHAERRRLFALREDEERTICTSHVERHNLTIRTLLRRFTRLALGFSKKLESLEAAVACFMAYYNFCWRTRYPDHSGKRGKRRPPAAMLANVTSRLWTFDDLFDIAMDYQPPRSSN